MHDLQYRSFHRLAMACLILFVSITSQAVAQNQEATPRFNYVLHDTLEQADVAHLVHALEENYKRVKDHFRVASLPTITVQIWAEEETYQQAMEERLGMRFPGSRGYVTGDSELRLLYHRRLSAQKEAVHEFAHVVSLNLNSNFGNNPRWLWEAVAMYAAEEFRKPNEVPELQNDSFPTLEELNTDFNSGRSIYDVGYVLVEYIVSNWGHDQLISLIQSNGAIEQTLGVSEAEFEAGWQRFVKNKYFG